MNDSKCAVYNVQSLQMMLACTFIIRVIATTVIYIYIHNPAETMQCCRSSCCKAKCTCITCIFTCCPSSTAWVRLLALTFLWLWVHATKLCCHLLWVFRHYLKEGLHIWHEYERKMMPRCVGCGCSVGKQHLCHGVRTLGDRREGTKRESDIPCPIHM